MLATTVRHRPGMVRNITSNWVMFIFSAVVGFFLSPFIVRTLGAVEYGVWTLLGSLVGYLVLLDIGVRGAVTRYVARFVAANDETTARHYASVALRLYLVLGGVAVLASVGLAAVVTRLFDLPATLHDEARLVLVLSGSAVVATLMGGVYGGIVVGLERFDLINLSNMGIEILRVVGVIAVLSQGFGIAMLAAVQLATALARLIVQAGMARAIAPGIWPRLRHWTWADARALITFSAASSLMHVAGLLVSYTDSIVIGAFLPVVLVTHYSIGSSLTLYARSVVSGISQVMTPRASVLDGQGAHAQLRTTFLSVSRLATLVTLPIAVTFLFRGATFIALWMGTEYAALAGDVLWILTIGLVFIAGRQVAAATMIGLNLHRWLAVVLFGEGLVNLGLSVMLVRTWGLVGVAVGSLLPSLAVSLGFFPWYVRRHLRIPMADFAHEAWMRPILAVIPFALVTVVIENAWKTSSLFVFFAQVAVALPLAAVGALAFGFSADERRRLLGYARAVVRPVFP